VTNTRLDAGRKTLVTYAYEVTVSAGDCFYTVRGTTADGVLLLVQALQEGEPKSTDGAIFPDISELDRKFGAVRMSAAFKEPGPWYPDDSGEWVETARDETTVPMALTGREAVQTLTRHERLWQAFDDHIYPKSATADWDICRQWPDGIVAYKVVKP